MAGVRQVGLAPALFVLLISVRVATAAAVECQHELAVAARAGDRAQAAFQIEAEALGGALCLVEEHAAPAQPEPTGTARDPEGPHLTSPCPFFKSPANLTAIVSGAVPHRAVLLWTVRGLGDQRLEAGAAPAAFHPRGPPGQAGEVLARAPRPGPERSAL